MIRSKWLRRSLVALAVILGLLLLLGVGGAFWFKGKLAGYMVPPPPVANARPLDSYAHEAPPARTPVTKEQVAFSWSSIANPPQSARPWARWWWPGADVDNAELKRELVELAAANFGGVEIQPFSAGVTTAKDPEAVRRVNEFDTPRYYDILHQTLRDADALGMQVDLTHFSGWPAGGPEVALEDGLNNLVYATARFSGGRRVELDLPHPEPGLNDYLLALGEMGFGFDIGNFARGKEKLVSVMAAKRLGGKLSSNPLVVDDNVTLDASSVHVLDAEVKGDKLVWDAPEGDWFLVASYVMPEGEAPTLIARDPGGYVLDPMRAEKVIAHYNYAYGARTGLAPFYGNALRGFFNDSLEFKANRLTATDILREFKARRGYDLEPHLPALFVDGKDNYFVTEVANIHASPSFVLSDEDARVRHDYDLTLSDLIVERFVETSRDWARARGLVSRGQSYGMDVDILRGLGANEIPETEQLFGGGSNLFLKFAPSAAALYGRTLVSSESFVWIDRDYTSSAVKLKAAADKLFLAGINHVIYHGIPYSWHRGEKDGPFGAEGWYPFSGPGNPAHFSDNYSPANPIWSDLPTLNSYMARVQNLMRQGQPKLDVLIYYPYLGFPNSFGDKPGDSDEALLKGALPISDPAPKTPAAPSTIGKLMPQSSEDRRMAWLRKIAPVIADLDRRGIGWGWVNGDALREGNVLPGGRMKSGAEYGALLFADVEEVEPATLEAVERLAHADKPMPVFFLGKTPVRQPGYLNADAGDAEVRDLAAALSAGGHLLSKPEDVASTIAAVLPAALAYRGTSEIRRIARVTASGETVHFFANQSGKAAEVALTGGNEMLAWWFDPASGAVWPAKRNGDGSLDLALPAYGSRVLVEGVAMPAGASQPVAALSTARSWNLTSWTVKAGDTERKASGLFDWRSDQAFVHAAEGLYTTQVTIDRLDADARYVLDLGFVPGAVSVRVNGTDAGRPAIAPALLDVTSFIREGENTLSISYRPPLRNVFIGKALAGEAQYRQFKDQAEALVPAGLIEPVSVEERIGAKE